MKLFDPAEGLQTLSSDLRCAIHALASPTTSAVADASVASAGGEDLENSTLVVDEADVTQGQLSSVALNVFVQVTLCLRHAHRVLQVLNSSLSRTLACTVYVNITALQALGGALVDSSVAGSSPTNSKNDLLSEEQLQVFVRKVLWQMDRADSVVDLNKTKKEKGGEGSDDEEFSDDEDDDDSQQQVRNMLYCIYQNVLCISSYLPLPVDLLFPMFMCLLVYLLTRTMIIQRARRIPC